MNCGIGTNRKWNNRHMAVLPFIFVSCSLTIEEIGRHSFSLKLLFYLFIFFYSFIFFILFYFFFLFIFFNYYFVLSYFILFDLFVSFVGHCIGQWNHSQNGGHTNSQTHKLTNTQLTDIYTRSCIELLPQLKKAIQISFQMI